MKRFLAFCLVFLMFFTGCGANKDDGKLTITATIFPQYDFLRQITKNVDVQLNMLISPGMEVHGFEATLQDVSTVTESDLFVYVGAEDDEWIKDIEAPDTKMVALSGIVEFTNDDHPWTSPKNAIIIVESLCNTLCEIDPDHADIYKENTKAYVNELKNLDLEIEKTVKNGKTNMLVFAERFPFKYLAKDYGLQYCSAFDGCSTETEASLKTVNSLIETIKKENIPAVFTIEFSEATVIDQICKETGAKKLLMHSCHNVTADEFNRGETYLSLMNKNVENLKIALGG